MRPAAGAAAAAALGAVIACASPEAERVRGGGPGADPGNRDAIVEIHAGAEMYAGTPCMTSLPRCAGPLPVSGLTIEPAGEGFAEAPEGEEDR